MRLQGKVALITGAARGQGRSHAVRLAREGVDVVGIDLCADVASAPYAGATADDLDETRRLVEKHDRRMLAIRADVRDQTALDAAVTAGLAEFGRLDVVCANAGILSLGAAHELSETQWTEMIDINLGGVWRTCKAAVPVLGDGGSIIITSSSAALRATQNLVHYAAAKSGLVGLMRGLAMELAPRGIRVNTVHPSAVDTPMIHHDTLYRLSVPAAAEPGREDYARVSAAGHPMGVPWLESEDISNLVAFLASDESRYLTGAQIPVMAGRDS